VRAPSEPRREPAREGRQDEDEGDLDLDPVHSGGFFETRGSYSEFLERKDAVRRLSIELNVLFLIFDPSFLAAELAMQNGVASESSLFIRPEGRAF